MSLVGIHNSEGQTGSLRSGKREHPRGYVVLLTPLPVLIRSHLTLAGENDMLLAVAARIRGLPLSFRGKSWWELTGALVLKNNPV